MPILTHGPATLHLLPARAAWWVERRALIVADTHFGKAATFRHSGIYVPIGTTNDTLTRLEKLTADHAPAELLILGDFFHARPAQNPGLAAAFLAWRTAHRDLSITLIRGNHDRHAGDPPPDWRITCVDEPYHHHGLTLRHFPIAADADTPTLAGHTHPAHVMRGYGRRRVRLPCFHLHENCLTLPAFGAFTGSAAIRPAPTDRIWLVGGDEVIEVEKAEKQKSRKTENSD